MDRGGSVGGVGFGLLVVLVWRCRVFDHTYSCPLVLLESHLGNLNP